MNSILLVVWQEGKTLKWRVENSWGEEYGVKGECTVTKTTVCLFPGFPFHSGWLVWLVIFLHVVLLIASTVLKPTDIFPPGLWSSFLYSSCYVCHQDSSLCAFRSFLSHARTISVVSLLSVSVIFLDVCVTLVISLKYSFLIRLCYSFHTSSSQLSLS